MNNDLISRSALKKCAIPCQIHNGALTDLCVPLYQIDNAPTVETQTKLVANVTFNKEQMEELVEKAKADILEQIGRPQGEWIRTDKDLKEEHPYSARWYRCSNCKTLNEFNVKTNFCPNCGANMKGGSE